MPAGAGAAPRLWIASEKPRACAASGRGSLAPAVFRGDDRDRKVDHGADVARKQAVKAAEERCIRLALKGDDHVCDPGIRLARQGVGLADELKRLWRVHVRGCVLRPAAGPVGAGGEAGGDDDAWGALGGVGGRGDHGACSIEKRDGREHVRVGERGGLAADGAQSCALSMENPPVLTAPSSRIQERETVC